jgi:hypothetical protein
MTNFADNYVAICQVMARYCRGIDRLDRDLLRSAYWDDAVDNHGIFCGPAPQFVEFIIPHLTRSYLATHHFIGQSLADIDGDIARSETYVRAEHYRGRRLKACVA